MTHRYTDNTNSDSDPDVLLPPPRPEEDEQDAEGTTDHVSKPSHKSPPKRIDLINQVDDNIRILREERDKATDPVIRSKLAERLVNLELKVEESRRVNAGEHTREIDSDSYVQMIRCVIEGLSDAERDQLLEQLEQ